MHTFVIMRCLGIDFFVLFCFKICSFNSTEIFAMLNMEQTLIYSFCTLIPVLYCSFIILIISNILIWEKPHGFFSPTMKISASRLTENLFQAPGSDFLSIIKSLFIHPLSLVAKTADIVIYTL